MSTRIRPPILELTIVRTKEFAREPEAIFWVFIFPLLLAVALGLAFRDKAPDKIPVAVINGPNAQQRLAALRKSPDLLPRVLSEADARWTPEGGLTPLIGIVNHLTHVEWRWIDGAMLGVETSRSEAEFTPGPELTVDAAITLYRARGAATDSAVWSIASLAQPTKLGDGTDLRFVLVHLINETARHAGHADATRQLLDGTTGE